MTVLGWIRSDARLYKPFVAHRIGEIIEITNIREWRWIPSNLNVADDATRIKLGGLDLNSRWIMGPESYETDKYNSKHVIMTVSHMILIFLGIQTVACEVIQIAPDPKNPVVSGLMVESYSDHIFAIKLLTPITLLERTEKRLLYKDMDRAVTEEYRDMFSRLRGIFDTSFSETLQSFSELIPFSVKPKNDQTVKEIHMDLRRAKRSPLRLLSGLLRIIRPVAQTIRRISKIKKLRTAMKIISYGTGGALISYEIADHFGLIPDGKYNSLITRINELERTADESLEIVGNVTLVTAQSLDSTQETLAKLSEAMSTSYSVQEARVRITGIINQYISQI